MSPFTSTFSKSAIASVAIAAAIALPLMGSSAAFAGDAYFAPTAVDDEYSTVQDTVLTVGGVGVVANDFSGDAGELLIDYMSLPSSGHISGLGSDGFFTFTPDAGFVGDVTITYAIKDQLSGFSSNAANVVIHVTAAPVKLIGAPDFYTTPMDTPLVAHADSVILNDPDITYVGGNDDATGEISMNSYGEFDYTPAAGFVGTKTFNYWLDDGVGHVSDPILVTITVTAPTPPVIPGSTIPLDPQVPTDEGLPTLAYTGATTSWLVAPALVLLAAGLGGIWFGAHRRRTAAL
ncbi:MAG: Ig-like domain-containing protein [Rhodoglobus sp.]